MKLLGLIGFPLTHSFSKTYFSRKFEQEDIKDIAYELFPIENITEFNQLLEQHPELIGLNVTIPYKLEVMPYLHELDHTAKGIGAVNTIKISSGRLKGFNTDVFGFEESLKPLLLPHHKKALILGTGGASKAITFVLDKLGLDYVFASRNPEEKEISYAEIDHDLVHAYPLIINATPLGTYPNVDNCPDLPYDELGDRNLLYDLVYNPEETLFLKKGKKQGAATKNGLEMLHLQAEKAWEIWNDPTL